MDPLFAGCRIDGLHVVLSRIGVSPLRLRLAVARPLEALLFRDGKEPDLEIQFLEHGTGSLGSTLPEARKGRKPPGPETHPGSRLSQT